MRYFVCLVAAATLGGFASPSRSQGHEVVNSVFVSKAESLKYVSKAIRLTLLERQWRLDKETDDSIQATLLQGSGRVEITVRITFDASKASIAFVEDKSREAVPPYRYSGWVDNLAKDIPVNLQRVQILLN